MVYLDPKNDITFKKVFAERPHLLQSFLNAMLPLPDDSPIVSLEYLPSEILPDIPALKNTMVDIRCRNAVGWQFLVEMQMVWTNSFNLRVLYNACKAFAHQIGKGSHFEGLQPVYSLSVINHSMGMAPGQWYHHFRLVHHELPKRHMQGLEFVFLEMPNFSTPTDEMQRIQTLWMEFLNIKNGTTMIQPELLEVPAIAEAVEVLKQTSYTPEELEKYDKYWDIVRTQRALVQDSEAKGREEGRQEGREEGMEKGIAEGAHQARLQMALKLKRRGYAVPEIIELTGLQAHDIEGLPLN